MACNICERNFQGYQSVIVSIVKDGLKAHLYVKNQGRNIVMIRRILLCYTTTTGGTTVLYLRAAPDAISWTYPSKFLETGLEALYYTLNIPNLKLVEAQAEYIEIDGRSYSCPVDF